MPEAFSDAPHIYLVWSEYRNYIPHPHHIHNRLHPKNLCSRNRLYPNNRARRNHMTHHLPLEAR